MSKHITEFTLQDAKAVVGNERLEWLDKVQDAITELESYDEKTIWETNKIYGEGFVEKELERLYAIRDVLELDDDEHDNDEHDNNTFFGINVTLKFSQGVDAESYEEAVEIVKDNFYEQYNIVLQDDEIDPKEFDLRSVLDLLDANGYEDASNFLQLHFAEEGEE